MTIQEIKENLPDIKIKLDNGEIVKGLVRGRNLRFAKVSRTTWGGFAFDVAWETIERCINNNTPLIL